MAVGVGVCAQVAVLVGDTSVAVAVGVGVQSDPRQGGATPVAVAVGGASVAVAVGVGVQSNPRQGASAVAVGVAVGGVGLNDSMTGDSPAGLAGEGTKGAGCTRSGGSARLSTTNRWKMANTGRVMMTDSFHAANGTTRGQGHFLTAKRMSQAGEDFRWLRKLPAGPHKPGDGLMLLRL